MLNSKKVTRIAQAFQLIVDMKKHGKAPSIKPFDFIKPSADYLQYFGASYSSHSILGKLFRLACKMQKLDEVVASDYEISVQRQYPLYTQLLQQQFGRGRVHKIVWTVYSAICKPFNQEIISLMADHNQVMEHSLYLKKPLFYEKGMYEDLEYLHEELERRTQKYAEQCLIIVQENNIARKDMIMALYLATYVNPSNPDSQRYFTKYG